MDLISSFNRKGREGTQRISLACRCLVPDQEGVSIDKRIGWFSLAFFASFAVKQRFLG